MISGVLPSQARDESGMVAIRYFLCGIATVGLKPSARVTKATFVAWE